MPEFSPRFRTGAAISLCLTFTACGPAEANNYGYVYKNEVNEILVTNVYDNVSNTATLIFPNGSSQVVSFEALHDGKKVCFETPDNLCITMEELLSDNGQTTKWTNSVGLSGVVELVSIENIEVENIEQQVDSTEETDEKRTTFVHFTNEKAPGQWMDVYNGGNLDKATHMAEAEGHTGQYWTIEVGEGGLHFRNKFNGSDHCLSVLETHKNGEHHVPIMAPCGSAPHQNWVFKSVQGGHGFVMRDFGEEECLTAVGPNEHLIMARCDSRDGQGWHVDDSDNK